MGCDIHVKLEASNGSGFYKEGELLSGRSYTLFSIMAGVRGDETPLVPPRGLPDDVSYTVKREAEDLFSDIGWHTPSWYTLDELKKIKKIYKKTYEYKEYKFVPECLELWLHIGEFYRKRGYEFRIVFWFDS